MANTVINTPELLNLDSTTGATVLAKGTISERPATPAFSLDYLVVAGGGGGGGGVSSESPGAGGAGAVIYQAAGLNVIPSSEYTLYIADGGTGGGNNSQGTNGQDSYISFNGSNVVLAKGGGGGGSYSGPGLDGGSGGGGTRDGDTNSSQSGGNAVTTNIAPAGASIYGNNGASGDGSCSGGGGGAGAVGTAPSGGNGVQINIDGNNYFWGGGGGACGSSGTGGQGGGGGGPRGGQGGTGGINPGASTGSSADGGGNAGANTGGGGGGATNPTSYPGGNGGSGIVILRYPNTQTITIGSGLTGTTATVGSDKVTTFTDGTGTISFSGTVVGGDNDATDGALRFNTDTNKTEYFDGTGWYEIVDEYASGFVGPGTNYFDTKLYTGNGGTQSIGGYINGAGSFNGSSSQIILPENSTVIPNNNFTYSLWFNSSSTAFQTLFSHLGSSTPKYGLFLNHPSDSSQSIRFFYSLGSNSQGDLSSSASVWAVDTWYNIVITKSSTNGLKGYLNNVEILSNTTLTADFTPYTLQDGNSNLGAYQYQNSGGLLYYFAGSIDQVRIYNAVLSSSDITALYGETSATASTATFPSGQTAVATYTMDTSANGLLTTTDLSTVDYPSGAGCVALYEMNGNSNDTSNTYNGTPTNIAYQGGAFDQAAVFNGSSSSINLGSSLTKQLPMSISLWLNPISTSNAAFYSNYSSSTEGFYCRVQSDGTFLIDAYNGGSNRTLLNNTTGSIPDNTWSHVAISFDSSNIILYVNGSETDRVSTNSNGIGFTSSEPTKLGVRGTSSDFFNGKMDQVRIFNTALTQSQVTTLARGIATSYSGTNTDVNFNGHLDFAPDFTWIKNRITNNSYQAFYDSVRGVSQVIYSNLANAEQDLSSIDKGVTSFDALGFTVKDDASGGYSINGASGGTYSGTPPNYVSWSWKAGGAAVTNNEGTISSQVSANKDSGFSIVKFNGYQSSGTTVGHGLSQSCKLIIAKNLDQTTSWPVWYDDAITTTSTTFTLEGSTKYLALNSTTSFISYTLDRQFGGQLNGGTGDEMIAYCWHSVAGYSSIATYEGSGSAGKQITGLGFAPRFVMIKNLDDSGSWIIHDKTISPNNPSVVHLRANTSDAEDSGVNEQIDFDSDGFTLNGTGQNINHAETYLYMAFA